MIYDILTYTCASTDVFAKAIKNYDDLIRKTGTSRFEVIELFNRTGFILSQFSNNQDLLRGQAINSEIYRQLIEANAIDEITAQHHQGRTLFSVIESK